MIQVLAVAALGDVKVDIATDYKHYEDNLKEPFLKKFPSGKIPAFESKDGFTLFESSAIARYSESLCLHLFDMMSISKLSLS